MDMAERTRKYLVLSLEMDKGREDAGHSFDDTEEGSDLLDEMQALWLDLDEESRDFVRGVGDRERVVSAVALQDYLRMEKTLLDRRVASVDFDDTEEGERLLDRMDRAWWRLQQEDIDMVNAVSWRAHKGSEAHPSRALGIVGGVEKGPEFVPVELDVNKDGLTITTQGNPFRIGPNQLDTFHKFLFPKKHVPWWRWPIIWFRTLFGLRPKSSLPRPEAT